MTKLASPDTINISGYENSIKTTNAGLNQWNTMCLLGKRDPI